MNRSNITLIATLLTIMFICSTNSTSNFLCSLDSCMEANLLCIPDNLLSVGADLHGEVDLNTEAFINSVKCSRPTLRITSAAVSPNSFSCQVHSSLPAIINATDDNGNCFIQTITATANDQIAPVIDCLPEVRIPVSSCGSLFGGLCYINLLDSVPEATVTDNCMEGSISLSGTLVSSIDLVVGDLLHLPFTSFGSFNVSYSFSDESGNEETVFSCVHIEGIQIKNPLPFAIFTISSLLKSVITVSFSAYSSVDTTAHLYLRAISTGTMGVVADMQNTANYIFVGTYSLANDIKLSSDVLINTASFHGGNYFLSLFMPSCSCFSVNDPIVTFLY